MNDKTAEITPVEGAVPETHKISPIIKLLLKNHQVILFR